MLNPNSSLVWHQEDIEITWMRDMGDMFAESGATNPFHHEAFVMDEILNRAICKPAAAPTLGLARGMKYLPVIDPMVRSFKPENLDSSIDWKFCTVICFIPATGVSYCVCERRREDVGIVNTMIQHDMSWLRMCHHIGDNGNASYGFADGGYVRRFATGFGDNCIPIWRIRSYQHD
jgi:hypothetical protein